jgi:hypothetical protein
LAETNTRSGLRSRWKICGRASGRYRAHGPDAGGAEGLAAGVSSVVRAGRPAGDNKKAPTDGGDGRGFQFGGARLDRDGAVSKHAAA